MKRLHPYSILRHVICLMFYALLIISHILCSSALAFTMLANRYDHGAEIESIWLFPLRFTPIIWAWLGGVVITSGYLVEIIEEVGKLRVAYSPALRLLAVAFVAFEISYQLWIFADSNRSLIPLIRTLVPLD